MKTLFILLALLICSTSNSQHYKKFLNNSAWIIQVADQGGYGPDVWYHCGKDTVVGNKTYTIIENNELGGVLLREDTIAHMVFFLKNSVEYVLYDFSPAVGQYIRIYPFMSPANAMNFRVTGIDSIVMHDGYHKRFWVEEDRQYGAQFEYVEGIGAMSNPFLIYNILSDPTYYLRCKYNGQYNVYSKDTSCKGNPFVHLTAIEGKHKQPFVNVYPNPANGVVYFNATGEFTVNVFDNSGRELFRLFNPSEIALSQGIYQFIYFFEGVQYTEKVLIY